MGFGTLGTKVYHITKTSLHDNFVYNGTIFLQIFKFDKKFKRYIIYHIIRHVKIVNEILKGINKMRRVGITYNEVAKAIAEIHGKRENATVDRIRYVLGTGSRSTIAKYLREWKEKHEISPNDQAGLPSELLALVQSLWRTLQEKSDQEIHQARNALSEKERALHLQLQSEKQAHQELQQKYHKLEESAQQQAKQLTTAHIELQKTQSQNDKLVEKVSALQTRQESHEKEETRLHELLRHMQSNLEHYQKTSQELRQEQMVIVEKQRNEYEQKLSHLQEKIALLAQEKSQTEVKYHSLEQSHITLQAENKKQIEENAQYQKEHDHYRIKYKSQQETLISLQKNYEEKSGLVTTMQIKLAAAEDKLSVTEKQRSIADDKIQSLRYDYQVISHEKAALEGQVQLLQTVMQNQQMKSAQAA